MGVVMIPSGELAGEGIQMAGSWKAAVEREEIAVIG